MLMMKNIILILFWCVVCVTSQCQNATICIANGKEKEGECPPAYSQILSNLTAIQIECKNIQIYITSGNHTLQKDLDFSESVQETEILGAAQGQPSIIQCMNNAGIKFCENGSKVLISNIMFLHCQSKRNVSQDSQLFSIQAALYLNITSYTLRGVTVMNTEGWGLYAYNCIEQLVLNCTFANNKGNIFMSHDRVSPSVEVNSTLIFGSAEGAPGILFTNCDFQRYIDSHLYLYSRDTVNTTVVIVNSIFNTGNWSGVSIECCPECKKITVHKSVFNNTQSGLRLEGRAVAEISDCLFTNHKETALEIRGSSIYVSKTNFSDSTMAISWTGGEDNDIKISECSFKNNTDNHIFSGEGQDGGKVFVEKSSFKENKGLYCSIFYANSIDNITLSDVNIMDNNCTGIELDNSKLVIYNSVRNHGLKGGGLYLWYSKLVFTTSSKLTIINNTADLGGGIFLDDEGCYSDTEKCFFQFEETNVPPDTKLIEFEGNSAASGGDAVFGGCLSNCYFGLYENETFMNKCSINANLVSSTTTVSPSTFTQVPERVAFCTNSTFSSVSCNDSHSVSVYRGQVFSVPIAFVDNCCSPTEGKIEAKVIHSGSKSDPHQLRFKHDIIQTSSKHCKNYQYDLIGGSVDENDITVEFTHIVGNIPPASLTVRLKDCPTGFEFYSNAEKCDCKGILKEYKINCDPSNLLLLIPPQTWMGTLEKELAVQVSCQFCKNEATNFTSESTVESDPFCAVNRTGVMCGACVAKYSLQLGGYECADCFNSTYKGVLLLVAFTVIGIALVLLLLGLNLTVSTGMINGLIFYSNIVYLNSDALLPISRESHNKYLQNTVRILSTFQAWMNLDFGIVTCFFDGYNTYISTWMQFVFPLYIWLLILIIVLASRYSNTISKITTSNTVSVLATLLLLSYAKLLKTVIETFSSVQLQCFNGSMTHHLWMLDANIPYLGQHHMPLFLMGIIMVLAYIIPFTLLILLGPLLQAKSHYRLLKWINKLKPFYDAFYGSYNSRYRYWLGILLLARVVILGTFGFYSPNDTSFKLLTITVMVAVLLAVWMAIGKINEVALNRKKPLNYLELFLLINLLAFTAFSHHAAQFPQNRIRNQQTLAVVMVGTVLLVSCGILGYQIFITLSKYQAIRKLVLKIKTIRDLQNPTPKQEDVDTKISHSLVEITECAAPNEELREPLLASQIHESSKDSN